MNVNLKKTLLLLAVFLYAAFVHAQTYDSIIHQAGWYDLDMREDMMQLRDGSILVHVEMFEVDEQGGYVGDYGNMFYKVSRNGATIMDSVFIADNDLNWFLLKRNPFDDDNVFAKLVRDLENHRTDLCIRFFDDDLNFYPEKEVWVPVSDTLFPPLADAYMMDEEGDILLHCHLLDYVLFMRVGLDGTVKTRSEIPRPTFPSMSYISGPRMGSFDMPPTKYGFWGFNDSNLIIVELDSLLNQMGILTPDNAVAGIEFGYGNKERILDWDEKSFLVSSTFDPTNPQVKNGVYLARYGKETLEVEDIRYFESKPYIGGTGGVIGCAAPFGLAKAQDGNIYFAYTTYCLPVVPYGQISVVKMDTDFNIIWQRFCLEPEGYCRVGSDLAVLDDGGVAVGGVIYGTPPEFFVLVFDDHGVGIGESASALRPYAYWPNPSKDALHLHFSPDVQPDQAELYDLQGRLVRTWRNGMERISLQGLAPGTYTLRVALEDGTVFTDKVVKE